MRVLDLALGGDDGVLSTWHVTGSSSAARPLRLPAPHDEHPELADAGGAAVRALAVISPETGLGLVIGVYGWGAALWQLPSRTLNNVFLCEARVERLPRGTDERLPRGTDEQLPRGTDWTALFTWAGPRAAADASPVADGHSEIGMNTTLGHVVVGAALGWVSNPPPPTAMAHSFTLTRGACTHQRAYAAPDDSMYSRTTMLTAIAAGDAHLIGCGADGATMVWNLQNTTCVRVIVPGLARAFYPAVRREVTRGGATSREVTRGGATTELLILAEAERPRGEAERPRGDQPRAIHVHRLEPEGRGHVDSPSAPQEQVRHVAGWRQRRSLQPEPAPLSDDLSQSLGGFDELIMSQLSEHNEEATPSQSQHERWRHTSFAY